MKVINKIVDGIINAGGVFGAFLTLFVLVSVVYEITVRSFTQILTGWVIEVTGWSLLGITFLAATWVLKEDAHVKLDIVTSHLNPRNQYLLNTVTSILGAMVCLAITWFSAQVTLDCIQTGNIAAAVLKINKAVFLFVIPLGSFLLFIQFLRRAAGYLARWKAAGNKEPTSQEP